MTAAAGRMPPDRRPLVAAGLLLGAGLGGFVDGIVFHQLLQWHNMLSAAYPVPGATPAADLDPAAVRRNYEVNMFWDGAFHALTWLTTVFGLALLFRAGRRPEVPWSGRTLVGAMLGGWGLFNLVEGVIDHHLLHVHHVREAAGVSAWDYGFLLAGAGLVGAGWLVARAGRADRTARGGGQPVTRPGAATGPGTPA